MGRVKQLAEQAGQEQPKPAEEKKPATFALAMKDQLEGARDQIMKALPNRVDAERFIMVALTAITRNDALQECGLPSVFLAVMECARTGLYPDNKEAAIIPYKGVATFQPMVQGLTRLMLRSPGLLDVQARAVFEGDGFSFQYGVKPDLWHEPRFQTEKVTHAYAVFWRQGAPHPTFEVVGRDEIEKARLTSRAPDSPAWKNWYSEMARKVAIKRLAKYADLSPDATRAIDLDNLVAGGEPLGTETWEGISPEYRNQIVRTFTQGGIERLKERMGTDRAAQQSEPPEPEPQAHPPLEQEMAQASGDGVVTAASWNQDLKTPIASQTTATETSAETPTAIEPAPTAAEPEPEAGRDQRERAFTPELLDEIVKDDLAPNREEAAKALGLSPWAKMKQPLRSRRPVFQWLRDFNEVIDIGGKPAQAAKKATERWQASGAPAGEEGAEEKDA